MPNPPDDRLAEHPLEPDSPQKAARRPETLSLFPDISETPLRKEPSPPGPSRKPRISAGADDAPLFLDEQRTAATQPPPEAPEAEPGEPVVFTRRVVSGLADLVILALVGAVELGAGAFFLDLRFPPAALLGVAAFLALVALVLQVLVPFVWGTTPGMALVDLRIASSDGGSPTLLASLLRFVGFALTGLFAGVPLLIAAFDRRGRTLADLFSRTTLVSIRRGAGPERPGPG